MALTILAAAALVSWIALLLAPWAPWWCREHLEPAPDTAPSGTGVTILVPARNEAGVIAETLRALGQATPGVPVIVVDDGSSDATRDLAAASGLANLTIIAGTSPPSGWIGKLWALEQGIAHVATPWVLLLDADIQLAPGMLAALEAKAAGRQLVSVCAQPNWDSVAARWLLPVFVYFFKLLYPFHLANRRGSRVAAAAGGVILVERAALFQAGGFVAWRGALIDDCTLAAHLKRAGSDCWIGLTRGARSLRGSGFADIGHMLARTAFVQLRESILALLAATALLLLMFWVPPIALAIGSVSARVLGLLAYLALMTTLLPTLIYYRRNPLAALLLPAAATFFLAATWYSAWRALAGTRSVWKGRRYQRGST